MFVAAQLVDWAFFALAAVGVERMRIDPAASVMVPFDLYHMPYTHSLVGTAIWAAAALAVVAVHRRSMAIGLLAALVVLSHWLLDWVVHVKDGRAPSLVIKGSLEKAKAAAQAILDAGKWPVGYWRDGGLGAFREKVYLKDVKKGVVPMTYWGDEEFDSPDVLGAMSWEHEQSGHSQSGVNELSAIVGRSHGFETVKPLKLMKKIMQIWCPPGGIVLDPFAGSGTTGHAVLELNKEAGANRRFVLIEQGRPERGDSYARTLTCERLRRAISGERVNKQGATLVLAEPLASGFRFSKLTSKVDATAVLSLQREEMLDLLITSHWDQTERAGAHLSRMPADSAAHLFARNSRGEGYFLVWKGPDGPSVLNRTIFREITAEAKLNGLTAPFHVYARTSVFPGPNIHFYQIPDRILEKLGFNEATQSYSQREDSLT